MIRWIATVALLGVGDLAAQPVVRCVPPHDTVRFCPEKYYPSVGSTPSFAQVAAIQGAMNRALAAEAERKKADDDWKNATDEEARLEFAKRRQKARERKYAAFNEVIELVSDGYGLRPPVTDFRQDESLLPSNREVEPWRPHFSEQQKWDANTRTWRERENGEKEAAAAQTSDRGRIAIFSDALTRFDASGNNRVALDPDEIALKIYHETIHWVNAVADASQYPRNPPDRDRPWAMIFAKESEAHRLTGEYAAAIGNAVQASSSAAKAAVYAGLAAEARVLPYELLRKRHADVFDSFRGGLPYADERPSEEEHLEEELRAIRREEARIKEEIERREDIDRAKRLALRVCSGEEVSAEDLLRFHLSDRRGLTPDIGDAPPGEGPTECAAAAEYDIRSMLADGIATAEAINEMASRRREQGALQRMDDVARECGFVLRRTRNTNRVLGFEELDPGGMSKYSFIINNAASWDPETMAAAMVVARACLRVTKFEANMSLPNWTPTCSDNGLNILARRWGDGPQHALLRNLSSSPTYHPENCIQSVSYRLPIVSPKTFSAAVDRAHNEYLANVKRDEQVWRENFALWERLRRREQGGREHGAPPGESGGGCANPNPDTGLVGCPQ